MLAHMYLMEITMFIECIKNNGIPYLRLVQGVRVTNKDGYRTSQKKVILSIGPLSRFDDGLPDYVERLKKSFKAGADRQCRRTDRNSSDSDFFLRKQGDFWSTEFDRRIGAVTDSVEEIFRQNSHISWILFA